MKLLRVFPRRTAATPEDNLVRVGYPDLFPPECDEIHVSVTFTYDIPKAEKMADAWRPRGPVTLGGPAYGDPGGEFTPGLYLKPGYVITSRGCPNRCWFCMAARREGDIRELKIKEGWNVIDNNLLACSDRHIRSVFNMLSMQSRKPEFTGGLEAKLIKPWIANELMWIKPKRIYFAYDTPNDKEPLAEAARTLWAAGMKPSSHIVSAYVLIGYPHDTLSEADTRLRFVASLGVLPFAMLYRDEAGKVNQKWRRFQREWCRPAIVGTKMAEARP